MSAKHTAGLLASDDARITCGTIAGGDYRSMGTAYGWDREFEYDEAGTLVNSPQASEEAIANAKLWAAAPEMLAALSRIVEWNSRTLANGSPCERGITVAQLDEARAALAKAGAA